MFEEANFYSTLPQMELLPVFPTTGAKFYPKKHTVKSYSKQNREAKKRRKYLAKRKK